MSGPRYAERYADAARTAGAAVLTETMVTGWSPGGPLELTGPQGRRTVEPHAVVLATGCRERPRSARLVPGSRPQGVMTTGTLQQLVYLHERRVGDAGTRRRRRARQLLGRRHARPRRRPHGRDGHRAAPPPVARAGVRPGSEIRYGTKLWTRTRRDRDPRPPTGGGGRAHRPRHRRVAQLECDTVVFTADWIPDHELAVDGGHRARPGHPRTRRRRRSAHLAARRVCRGKRPPRRRAGRRRGAQRPPRGGLGAALFDGSRRLAASAPAVVCRPPLHWISPTPSSPGGEGPPRGHFTPRGGRSSRGRGSRSHRTVETLWTGRRRRLVPGRSARLPIDSLERVDPEAGPIEVSVQGEAQRPVRMPELRLAGSVSCLDSRPPTGIGFQRTKAGWSDHCALR